MLNIKFVIVGTFIIAQINSKFNNKKNKSPIVRKCALTIGLKLFSLFIKAYQRICTFW